MIPYVGKDPDDVPFLVASNPVHRRSAGAWRMFGEGKDTHEIAAKFHVRESTIERWITTERSRRLGLPNPYEV